MWVAILHWLTHFKSRENNLIGLFYFKYDQEISCGPLDLENLILDPSEK